MVDFSENLFEKKVTEIVTCCMVDLWNMLTSYTSQYNYFDFIENFCFLVFTANLLFFKSMSIGICYDSATLYW